MNKRVDHLQRYGQRTPGFTIVELLIVVVVIAILAAITIVAYNGIQQRAKSSALQSAVSQLAKRIEASKVDSASDTYPASLSAINVQAPANTSYSVAPSGKAFCISGADGQLSFYATAQQLQPAAGDCVTANGLVGWWRFNNNLTDSSGYNADATTNNASPTTGEDGTANSAYSFGSSQVTSASSAAIPTGAAARTVLAWVNANAYPAASSWSMVASWGTSATASASALSINSAGKVAFNSQSNDFTSNFTLPLNQWHLIGYTVTGSSLQIIYDGTVQAATLTSPVATLSGPPLYIGAYINTSLRWSGSIDDLRIYNRVLANTELQAIYNAGAL